jgi:hypothetical protein
MKFNGSAKQNKWAESILQNANLTEDQVDNLLRWAGPTLHDQGIMDVTIVIENRNKLAAYADSLGELYKMSKEERHALAEEAAGMVRQIAKEHIG